LGGRECKFKPKPKPKPNPDPNTRPQGRAVRPWLNLQGQREAAFLAKRMADLHPHPFPPPWAEAWGDDRFGLWAALLAGEVTQRMRYLPPGSFLMGSPPDEAQRNGDEGPQHQVTLTQGLWLADTACTQGLWLAVMGGKNPSRFTGDLDLPVEQVSWDEVQEFLAQLQAHLPAGVEAVLPTEAQWEYACRAGSTTPFSFGHQISTNQVNYDGNYPYNNGPNGEYRGTTVPVKALPANPWGLYQMHGNVWEWCADAMRTYTKKAVTDSSGASSEGSESLAVRGGSWIGYAQGARSAQRYQDEPGGRLYALGFRFALRSTGQPGAGGPVSVGRSPSLGRDGPVLGVRSTRRKK
jgi:formylglycine-generating enzyme required for sulfatase activity